MYTYINKYVYVITIVVKVHKENMVYLSKKLHMLILSITEIICCTNKYIYINIYILI